MANLSELTIVAIVALLILVFIVILNVKSKSSNKNLKKKFHSQGYKNPFSWVQELKGAEWVGFEVLQLIQHPALPNEVKR